MAEVLYGDLQVVLHGEDALADVWVGGCDCPVLCSIVALQQKLHEEKAEVPQLVEDGRGWVGRRCCGHLEDEYRFGTHRQDFGSIVTRIW